MTQANLFKYVVYGALAALLVPVLVALSNTEGANSAANRVAKYLGIAEQTKSGGANKDGVQDNVDGNKITVDNPQSGSSDNNSVGEKTVAKAAGEYVVKAGDTYGCIAENYYGSYEQYPMLMAANGATKYKGFSERKLHVGAKLVLPAVTASQLKPATNLCD